MVSQKATKKVIIRLYILDLRLICADINNNDNNKIIIFFLK